MDNKFLLLLAVAPILLALLIVLIDRRRTRKTMDTIEQMLGAASEGNYAESHFDESRLSALETKFSDYLSSCALSAQNVTVEKDKIKQMISDISHQTKTPIANILLYTQLLKEQPGNTDCLEALEGQTKKLQSLIDALVKTSRLETGVIQLDKKLGRLFDTVAQAMSGIVYAAEKKEIAVSVDCPEDLTVSHDSKWTSEALFNLLDNAVKYTPAGGKIAVSVVLWEMYVEIKVADNGKGISESNQAAIFRRFYREEEVHSEPGVGIGLYLAREIITRQGGYIKVVSAPGNGSEFSIMLPAK